VAVVIIFSLAGVGALCGAGIVGRSLWRDRQRGVAVVVGALTVAFGLFSLWAAWIWWDGPLGLR
jgi:hypothetical protein